MYVFSSGHMTHHLLGVGDRLDPQLSLEKRSLDTRGFTRTRYLSMVCEVCPGTAIYLCHPAISRTSSLNATGGNT